MVSKEVSTLESEMQELKEALNEWKNMPSLLHIDDSASVAGAFPVVLAETYTDIATERRRNVRSSIADLRVLYANQMQTLHAQIEGSSKFVPTTPGRHVITEIDSIYALNSATYKVDHSCRFVLLDDADKRFQGTRVDEVALPLSSAAHPAASDLLPASSDPVQVATSNTHSRPRHPAPLPCNSYCPTTKVEILAQAVVPSP